MAVDRRKTDDPPGVVGPHVENALELTALEAARHAARKTAKTAAGGYFALLLVLFIGAGYYQWRTNGQVNRATAAVSAANDRLAQSETRACERLQTQRERANVGEARDYLLMVAIARAPRASTVIRDEYAGLARTARYDPPTDCADAVRRPNSYRRPASVPYCAADDPRLVCDSALPTVFARAIVRAAQEGKPQPIKGG